MLHGTHILYSPLLPEIHISRPAGLNMPTTGYFNPMTKIRRNVIWQRNRQLISKMIPITVYIMVYPIYYYRPHVQLLRQ